MAMVNDLGYGKNVKDITMDNPQPSPKFKKSFKKKLLKKIWVKFTD